MLEIDNQKVILKKNIHINDAPILPLLICYIIGVLSYEWLYNKTINIIMTLICFAICVIYFFPFSAYIKFIYSKIFTLNIYLIFFLIAQLNVGVNENKNNEYKKIKDDKHIVYLKLGTSKNNNREGKYQHYTSQCISNLSKKGINNGNENNMKNGYFSLSTYFPKKFSATLISLNSNTILLCYGTLRKIKNRVNPFEFNYEGYMKNRNIEYCFYADSLCVVETGKENFITDKSIKIRKKVETIIEGISSKRENIAFLKALTIGEKSEINEEQRGYFAMSGLSHILAVSGMHTGIIYLILSWILAPLLLIRGRVLKLLLSLMGIIIFCFVAGLSASVVRASVMISIIIISRIFFQRNNSLSALSITAFIMLIYNPFFIYDVGFQLSFVAVLSILIYYPIIEKLYYDRSISIKESDKITYLTSIMPQNMRSIALWIERKKMKILSLINLSVSAQILTLPISVYYFNIIPFSFIITNLIVIPLLFPLFSILLLHLFLMEIFEINLSVLSYIIDGITSFINGTTIFFSNSFSWLRYSNIFIKGIEIISNMLFIGKITR